MIRSEEELKLDLKDLREKKSELWLKRLHLNSDIEKYDSYIKTVEDKINNSNQYRLYEDN